MVLFTGQVSDDNLKHMLLSPRATVVGDDNYTCCQSCYTSLSSSKREEHSTPPKHAANGFAIGHVPEILTHTDINGDTHTKRIHPEMDLDDKLCAAILPMRPFGFVHAFNWRKPEIHYGTLFFFQCKSESCRRCYEQV